VRVHDAETGAFLGEGSDDALPWPDVAEAIRAGQREVTVPPVGEARAFVVPRDAFGADLRLGDESTPATHPYRSAAARDEGGAAGAPRAVRFVDGDGGDILLVPVAVEGPHVILEDARGRTLRVVAVGQRPPSGSQPPGSEEEE
jgi:hypothetical protein